MGEKELGTVGLDNVWKKVFGLTKLITGNVDVKQKGNLQTQINNIQVNINKVFGNEDNPDGEIGFVEGIEADNIIGAINEVFQLGSEKKNKLVENLTVMGIKASTDETWEELLDKVLDMTDTSKDTVTAEVLLEEYTAHDAKGEPITGIMPERASVTVDTTGVTQDSSYTYFGVPEGHYDENSKVRAINSDLLGDIYDAFVAIGITPAACNSTELSSAVSNAYDKGASDTAAQIAGSVSIDFDKSNSYNGSELKGDIISFTTKRKSIVTTSFSFSVNNHDNSGDGDFSGSIYIGNKVVASDSCHVSAWGGGSIGKSWSGNVDAGMQIRVYINIANGEAINWAGSGKITAIGIG